MLAHSIGLGSLRAQQTITRMAPQKRKVGAEEATTSVAEQLQAAASPQQMRNQCLTFFTRTHKGFYKNSSGGAKEIATQALEKWKDLSEEEKDDFAKQFQANKGNKNFSWAKEYMEKLIISKRTKDDVIEKYMTRIP